MHSAAVSTRSLGLSLASTTRGQETGGCWAGMAAWAAQSPEHEGRREVAQPWSMPHVVVLHSDGYLQSRHQRRSQRRIPVL